MTTKFLVSPALVDMMGRLGLECRPGRASLAPEVAKDEIMQEETAGFQEDQIDGVSCVDVCSLAVVECSIRCLISSNSALAAWTLL